MAGPGRVARGPGREDCYASRVPPLSPLLDVQELDIAADALNERLRDLPERAERLANQQHARDLDAGVAELEAQRETLNASERGLAGKVADMAARAKEAEDKLYSGGVKVPKELEGLQEELRVFKEKQSELEDGELLLMEQIEATELAMSANREQRAASDTAEKELDASIAAAEAEIDDELSVRGASRQKAAVGIPAAVLEKYAELRKNVRMRGRPAARLESGTCQGCRVQLPIFEHHRIQDEAPTALVRCPQCRRVLIR
jgi:predicted  nucleic acid-binding Zn-ribbon protein